MIPINFVDATVCDLTPDPLRLPPIAWSVFALWGKARSTWRWYRRAELYGNPKNFAHLLVGHVVDYLVGDRLLIRIAAHSLLIATRLLECVQAQEKVWRRGEELKNAILGRYAFCIKNTWFKGSFKTFGLLSPSTVAWWQTTCQEQWVKISRIGLSLLLFVYSAFELSMRIADAVDVFYMPPEAQSASVPTCFVNAAKWLEAIVSNKEELLTGLSENQALIERIIQHSPFTYSQLYQSVARSVGAVEILHDCSNAVSEFAGETAFNIGKRSLGSAAIVLGFF